MMDFEAAYFRLNEPEAEFKLWLTGLETIF